MNLFKNIKLQEVLAPVAAASDTDSNSDRLDMSGFDGVMFIVPITDSVDTGVATLNIQQNTIDSDTGMATTSSATATSAANDDLNNKLLVVDVYRPAERYVQGNITSATANIAYGNMIAIQYKGSKMPISAAASIATSTVSASPAEA